MVWLTNSSILPTNLGGHKHLFQFHLFISVPCIEITGFKSSNSVGKGTDVIKAFDEPNNIPVSTVYGYDLCGE